MPAPSSPDRAPVVERASVLARRWVAEAAVATADRSDRRVSGVLHHESSRVFTRRLLDGVLRPEGVLAGAAQLRQASGDLPEELPWHVRGLIRAGGGIAAALPSPTVPIARRVLRELVGSLVADLRPSKLSSPLARIAANGAQAAVHVVGEAVLGSGAAQRRVDEIGALIARDDLHQVSFTLSDLIGPRDLWSFDATVDAAVAALAPLCALALAHDTRLTLDIEEHADLDLAIAAFTGTLEDPQLRGCEAGIGLPAALTETLPALREVLAWATDRVAHGGAPTGVRLIGGPAADGDRAQEILHGWANAAHDSRADIDANLLRMLDEALRQEHAGAVHVTFAAYDPFLIACAWSRAETLAHTDALSIEVPWGLSDAQILAIQADVGALTVSVPAARREEWDAATGRVLRRGESVADMQAVFAAGLDPATGDDVLDIEQERVAAAVRSSTRTPDGIGGRTQDRSAPVHESIRTTPTLPAEDEGLTDIVLGISRGSEGDALLETAVYARLETAPDAGGVAGFENAPATDLTRAANREWAGRLRSRIATSGLGVDTAAGAAVTDADRIDQVVAGVHGAAAGWAERSAADRAEDLQRAAAALESRRADLIEVAGHEAGVLPADADAEVDRAIDLARYYAATARELEAIPGAVFVPDRVTVVAPSWSAPMAVAAEGVLAALATGSGVILMPSPRAARCAAVLAEVLWGSGIPRDVLALVIAQDGELVDSLFGHPDVDRVLATGSERTAERVRSRRRGAAWQADVGGAEVIVVAPSADVDLAVESIVRSAFGRAGQDRASASVVVLVGAMGRSRRFARQLADATRSLTVGWPHEERVDVGPLIEPPQGEAAWALTELEREERWIVEPAPVTGDETGRLWSPGIRAGVLPGSRMHVEPFLAPVLAVMHAPTLAQAIAVQNAVPSGLAAGLHTRDPEDLAVWLDGVEAGTLWVNRATTGAVVQRHPSFGWKASSAGSGAADGGPNRLIGLGSWRASAGGVLSSTLHLRGLDSRITDLIESAQPSLDFERFEWLRQSALSDAIAWGREFGQVRDASQLGVERDLLRYRPVPVMVRATEDAGLQELLRVIIAAIRSGARFVVSTPSGLPADVRRTLTSQGAAVAVESDDEWLDRMRASSVPQEVPGEEATGPWARARLIGSRRAVAALRSALAASGDSIRVHADEVTSAGRLELLTFLREQSVSITSHRFGTVDEWSADVI